MYIYMLNVHVMTKEALQFMYLFFQIHIQVHVWSILISSTYTYTCTFPENSNVLLVFILGNRWWWSSSWIWRRRHVWREVRICYQHKVYLIYSASISWRKVHETFMQLIKMPGKVLRKYHYIPAWWMILEQQCCSCGSQCSHQHVIITNHSYIMLHN